MRRIMLTVEYDGTNYAGWQRQPNAMSVQQLIEENLQAVTKQPIVLHASGRTDSGVHALGQVAHFDTLSRMAAEKFVYALNAGLPRDIRVVDSREVRPDFHARFCAKRKSYRYTIDNSPVASALYRNFRLHLHAPLDIGAMGRAAKLLEGEHDFAAFAATGHKIKNTVREIYSSNIESEGSLIHYNVEGNGFLYNMVRIIAGTLIDIGYGRLSEEALYSALTTGIRRFAGATAPPHGLILVKVVYPREYFEINGA